MESSATPTFCPGLLAATVGSRTWTEQLQCKLCMTVDAPTSSNFEHRERPYYSTWNPSAKAFTCLGRNGRLGSLVGTLPRFSAPSKLYIPDRRDRNEPLKHKIKSQPENPRRKSDSQAPHQESKRKGSRAISDSHSPVLCPVNVVQPRRNRHGV